MGTRWERLSGASSGEEYADRFQRLAADGRDVHGEATFCEGLVGSGARILDAGCGTGRIAIRLAEQGFDVVGVDLDESMLSVARRAAPDLTWLLADLANLPDEVAQAGPFDLVVLAGNVVPLLAEDTMLPTITGLVALLAEDGLLVAGFGLDAAHLPPGCPVTELSDYDEACAEAGLVVAEQFATWGRDPWEDGAGYAVSVHERAER